MAAIPSSLQALLTNLIDYAGLYPPAELALPEVTANYERYLRSPDGWMLNRLVLPLSSLPNTQLGSGCRLTLLVEDEPGALPPAVESLETKLARKLSLPTYCEAPLESIEGAFAKIRTGGVTPGAIPDSDSIARFLARAAERRTPFKATAGLHHPVRAPHPLTYAPDSPRAIMHGFLNVFTAAAFAWFGLGADAVAALLNEEDPRAFEFHEDEVRWRGLALSADRIRTARLEFAHSFGSCSFEEPVAGLKDLGLLP